jgi:hypothetical protein
MNKYGSNYHIYMDLKILVWHYNYLVLHLCHYLILVCTCEYVHGYTLNIINKHSFFIWFTLQLNMKLSRSVLLLQRKQNGYVWSHSINILFIWFTLQPNTERSGSILQTENRMALCRAALFLESGSEPLRWLMNQTVHKCSGTNYIRSSSQLYCTSLFIYMWYRWFSVEHSHAMQPGKRKKPVAGLWLQVDRYQPKVWIAKRATRT